MTSHTLSSICKSSTSFCALTKQPVCFHLYCCLQLFMCPQYNACLWKHKQLEISSIQLYSLSQRSLLWIHCWHLSNLSSLKFMLIAPSIILNAFSCNNSLILLLWWMIKNSSAEWKVACYTSLILCASNPLAFCNRYMAWIIYRSCIIKGVGIIACLFSNALAFLFFPWTFFFDLFKVNVFF